MTDRGYEKSGAGANVVRLVEGPAIAGAPKRPLIQLDNLSKRYGGHTVLEGIDLEVMSGEVVAIIGPSGSGKSTLLRCINYLEPPDGGLVTIGDITLSAAIPASSTELARLRRSVGMVFQSFNLFPHMTVLRNISLAQERVLGRSRKEAEERSMQLLKRVGLGDKAGQYPARCSGGQQQRVAIARSLALDPQVMLFDEPTSALDPELGLEVLAVMRELAETGMTMIVVTHEMSFAENVSDTVMIMADGRIVEKGPSTEVMRNPQHERTKRFLRAVHDR
ncbi:amino acid ABC transporter ATP-binding protein [Mesorhizobium sp. M7D.F.Ca.US.004.03.1.1]|nr:amino acid ABC transporter ATP-binding protein [Mesorhizobium sp. M7D.F.Ca.US.004.01.2.1]RVA34357.1 amino acid ABC transporter ATP-binding protein [Mesorhizobium sp. M7D.F.Ca.US.004.03.1.1]